MDFLYKFFLGIVFFSISNPMFSQDKFTLKYYDIINKAELKIASNELDSACCYYFFAKKITGRLFAKDSYNLMQCLLLIKKTNAAKEEYINLRILGSKKEWLTQKSALSDSVSEKWEEELKSRTKNSGVKTTSSGLIDSLNRFFLIDQEYRKKPNSFSRYKKEIRESDSINIESLKLIIQQYGGLPDEALIGVGDESLIFQPFFIHILHQSHGVKQFDYSDIILSGIKTGKINPHLGAYLYMRTSGNFDFFGPISLLQLMYPNDSVTSTMLYDQNFIEEYSKKIPWMIQSVSDSIRIIKDSIRLMYGLDSIRDFEKKVLFQFNNQNFTFYYLPYVRNFFVCRTKEDAEIIGKGFKILSQ